MILWNMSSVSLRQFSVRQNTSYQTASLNVQEVIHSYIRENSKAHCTLIDLTKAFEQMNFDALLPEPQNT